MKTSRFRKIAATLLLSVIVATPLAWFTTRTPASAFDGVAAAEPASEDLIHRGEYVARLADCLACHSTPQGKPFAGGLEMATPIGAIFATNITPDKTTGIGSYTLADFDRALRHGVAADGRRLYPAMPYPSYAKLADDDVQALYAFFRHGVPSVREPNRPGQIPWPLNMRWPLALWSAVFTQPGAYQVKTPAGAGVDVALWNRGAYIVQGPGHCGSCHTPRGIAMDEKALDERSPQYLSGAPLDGWFAPSLRGDVNTGLSRWTKDEVVQFLKTGRNRHAVVFGSMAEAFNNSTQFMADEDLRAVAHYLKSLPGDAGRDGAPWQYDAGTAAKLTLAQRASVPGAESFAAKCSACHGLDGRGQAPWIPPLAGSVSSLAKASDSAINVTLNGSARVVAAGVPDAYRMPAFRDQLSDQQVADVLSFVRTSWGNRGGAVSEKDVVALRGKSAPADSSPVILQMH